MNIREIITNGDSIEINTMLRQSINNKTMQEVIINTLITFNPNMKDDIIVKIGNFFDVKNRLNINQKVTFCKQICILDRYELFKYLYNKEIDTKITNSSYEGFTKELKEKYKEFVIKYKVEFYNQL